VPKSHNQLSKPKAVAEQNKVKAMGSDTGGNPNEVKTKECILIMMYRQRNYFKKGKNIFSAREFHKVLKLHSLCFQKLAIKILVITNYPKQ